MGTPIWKRLILMSLEWTSLWSLINHYEKWLTWNRPASLVNSFSHACLLFAHASFPFCFSLMLWYNNKAGSWVDIDVVLLNFSFTRSVSQNRLLYSQCTKSEFFHDSNTKWNKRQFLCGRNNTWKCQSGCGQRLQKLKGATWLKKVYINMNGELMRVWGNTGEGSDDKKTRDILELLWYWLSDLHENTDRKAVRPMLMRFQVD